MFFYVKKFLTILVYPLTHLYLALILSFWLFLKKKTKTAYVVLFLFSVVVAVFSSPFVVRPIVLNYESKYPYPTKEQIEEADVNWIVVYGGGVDPNEKYPITSQLPSGTLVRLIEGIRIHFKKPQTKLLLSGGQVWGGVTEAGKMKELALELGVEPKKITLEEESRDTKDQAINIKNIVGDEVFILITSAYHMNRSVQLCLTQNLSPLPLPVGHLVIPSPNKGPYHLFPEVRSLVNAGKWIREHIGIIHSRLRGQIVKKSSK